eukprot:1157452-Pelagomonas_calceolata.AAC.2
MSAVANELAGSLRNPCCVKIRQNIISHSSVRRVPQRGLESSVITFAPDACRRWRRQYPHTGGPRYKACSAHGAEEPCEPGEKQGNVWCPETLHCLLISSTVMMVSSSRRAISARRAVSLHYTTLHCMVQSPDEPGGWHGADARDETGDIANRVWACPQSPLMPANCQANPGACPFEEYGFHARSSQSGSICIDTLTKPCQRLSGGQDEFQNGDSFEIQFVAMANSGRCVSLSHHCVYLLITSTAVQNFQAEGGVHPSIAPTDGIEGAVSTVATSMHTKLRVYKTYVGLARKACISKELASVNLRHPQKAGSSLWAKGVQMMHSLTGCNSLPPVVHTNHFALAVFTLQAQGIARKVAFFNKGYILSALLCINISASEPVS